MKKKIETHKAKGKVYIWTYKDNIRNYPGWNYTVDLEASKNLSDLLDLMKKCEWSSKKTLLTELPTDFQIKVPNNQCKNTKWKSKPKLTLNCKTTESEDFWSIKVSKDRIEIIFGKGKLIELQNAINDIPKGNGDYAISDQNDENILYFWWNLEKRKNNTLYSNRY